MFQSAPRIVVWVMAALLALAVAGCGASADEEAAAPPQENQAEAVMPSDTDETKPETKEAGEDEEDPDQATDAGLDGDIGENDSSQVNLDTKSGW